MPNSTHRCTAARLRGDICLDEVKNVPSRSKTSALIVPEDTRNQFPFPPPKAIANSQTQKNSLAHVGCETNAGLEHLTLPVDPAMGCRAETAMLVDTRVLVWSSSQSSGRWSI
jgi:hypothetical protein